MNKTSSCTISARGCGWTKSPANSSKREPCAVDEFPVSGLTSHPTIFDEAIGNTMCQTLSSALYWRLVSLRLR